MDSANNKSEEEIKEYLKQLHHPEISAYGLDLDYSSYAAFNKELWVRKITFCERLRAGLDISLDEVMVLDVERNYAQMLIEYFKSIGIINSITYEINKERTTL